MFTTKTNLRVEEQAMIKSLLEERIRAKDSVVLHNTYTYLIFAQGENPSEQEDIGSDVESDLRDLIYGLLKNLEDLSTLPSVSVVFYESKWRKEWYYEIEEFTFDSVNPGNHPFKTELVFTAKFKLIKKYEDEEAKKKVMEDETI